MVVMVSPSRFELVVTGARPDARHVAVIGLRRRHRLRIGVAVDLARREEQEALDVLVAARELQEILGALHRALDGLERVAHVVDRRGDAGGMQDEVQVLAHRQRIGHVGPDIENVGIVTAVVMLLAGDEIVGGDDPARLAQHAIVEAAEHGDEMPSQEAGAAGDQDRLAGKAVGIVAQILDDLVGVVLIVAWLLTHGLVAGSLMG